MPASPLGHQNVCWKIWLTLLGGGFSDTRVSGDEQLIVERQASAERVGEREQRQRHQHQAGEPIAALWLHPAGLVARMSVVQEAKRALQEDRFRFDLLGRDTVRCRITKSPALSSRALTTEPTTSQKLSRTPNRK